MQKYNINDLEHRELISKTGERFSKSAVLSDCFSCQHLFIHHEILAPGRRASASHTHTNREEVIYVLEGCLKVHQGEETKELKPGDFIGFIPGSSEAHFVENTTEEEVRFLVICSNPENDEVILTKNWEVYIIQAESGKLYTGITTDLKRRFEQHQKKSRGARFFHFSNPQKLLFRESFSNRSEASKRECAIKKMSRKQKLDLIGKSSV